MSITATIHRPLRFTQANRSVILHRGAQIIPPDIAAHPYFAACIVSGWVTDVCQHEAEADLHREEETPAPRNQATRTRGKGR